MLLKGIVALTGITLTVLILFFTPVWGTAILLSFLCGLCCYELLAATGAIRDRAILTVSKLCAVAMPWLWYSGTQEDFAELLGVSSQSVSRWENGVCYPDMDLIPSISNYFGVSIDELFGFQYDRDKKIDAILAKIDASLS